jgi:hypothetical protein
MLQIGRMSPHKPHPVPRKIEVDLSAILVRPGKPRSTAATHPVEPENTFHKQNDRPVHSHDVRIGPSGWTNINFVVGSCLVALFCAIFVSDNFEFSRRRAHLKDDVVYSRPELDSTGASGFSLEPAQLVSGMQLDHPRVTGFNEKAADLNPSPVLSTLQPTHEFQTLGSSPNTSRIADSASASNSSSAGSDGVGRDSVSRTTSSKSTSASGSGRAVSVRSSMTRSTRHSRSLSNAQLSRHSLANRFGKTGVGRSMSQTTGPAISGLKLNNQQSRSGAAQIETVAARNVMSMHSMGQGSVLTQSRGAMNPMRMESGMLAQPAIGAGLGGLSGNNLGGAGNHGGNARR